MGQLVIAGVVSDLLTFAGDAGVWWDDGELDVAFTAAWYCGQSALSKQGVCIWKKAVEYSIFFSVLDTLLKYVYNIMSNSLIL